MTAYENKIRDYLADHLLVLDNGLQLVKKEYVLSNSFGAGGRIDILAKDQFGNYVVIELKRSDQSARQALHELFKYMSIIHRQLGVAQTHIRAILVSTTWHELALPFSEYLLTSPFHTEGYEIDVDFEGKVISTTRFQPIILTGPLEISRCQSIYLYAEEKRRNENTNRISECLTELSVTDHVLLNVDYSGHDRSVIYPYGTYVIFSSPFHVLTPEQQAQLKKEIDWQGELDQEEENFLIALTHHFTGHDTLEIGYPEKLSVMAESWRVSVAVRAGRFKANESLMSDSSIFKNAIQAEGGSPHYASCIISPKFADRWFKAKDDISLIALGNSLWTSATPYLLDEIAARDQDSCVSIKIYNLADTHYALSRLCLQDCRFFPILEIVSKERDGLRIFCSHAVWDRKPFYFTPEQFFEVAFGDATYWLTARHFGEQSGFDDAVQRKIGLKTPIWERWLPVDGEPSLSEINWNGALTRKAIASIPNHGLDDLLHGNSNFFINYRNLLSKVASGLFDKA